MSQPQPPKDLSPEAEAVVLVGNPNVGKSVLFKNLTNRYVVVSNFPGTTVDITRARANFNGRDVEVLDTPGINDLGTRADDARVTREILDSHGDAILVQVADAKNLRRALLLTLQLAELGHRLVLVLNMFDELKERGGRIDTEKLSEILGVPVVTTVAARNFGTQKTIDALQAARPPQVDLRSVEELDDEYEKNHARLTLINEILAQTYSISQPRQASLRVRLGFWAMHPVKGVACLVAVLAVTFWFVGLFGAGFLVDLMEVGLFQRWINPAVIHLVDALVPFPHTHEIETISYPLSLPLTPVHELEYATVEMAMLTPRYSLEPGAQLSWGESGLRFLHDFLVGEYGMFTMALSYAFAIVLPIVTTFFLLFSLLEDSGYLPRMAIMVNRIFRLMGLNGKAVLPMILGLGCDTMATMTTRILETRKERIVTTMLLALAVPCSAQLGVLLAMMAKLSFAASLFWVALMIGVIFTVGWLTARLFDGDGSDFILEIPPMRWPQPANVRVKTLSRLMWYLREVIPLFVIGTAALFLLDKIHLLEVIARLSEPLVTGWLGLPKEMANAFLIGFLRRDFGAVYLLDAATGPDPVLNPHQIFVAMITITLFMPCIANFLMIAKEHGFKIAWAMAAFIFPFAFFVGGMVNHLAP
ncbi:MAG: ferrous iron transporter B [bacterium]|nr:ferrous iron transporter B [bacterium]